MKTKEEVLSDTTNATVYRLKEKESQACITPKEAMQAMESYAAQFVSEGIDRDKLMVIRDAKAHKPDIGWEGLVSYDNAKTFPEEAAYRSERTCMLAGIGGGHGYFGEGFCSNGSTGCDNGLILSDITHWMEEIEIPLIKVSNQNNIGFRQIKGDELKIGDEWWENQQWNKVDYLNEKSNWMGNNICAVKSYKETTFLIKVSEPATYDSSIVYPEYKGVNIDCQPESYNKGFYDGYNAAIDYIKKLNVKY